MIGQFPSYLCSMVSKAEKYGSGKLNKALITNIKLIINRSLRGRLSKIGIEKNHNMKFTLAEKDLLVTSSAVSFTHVKKQTNENNAFKVAAATCVQFNIV